MMAKNTDQLSALGELSVIVADTGELNEIKKFKPIDATTNPSLLLNAAQLPEYKHIIDNSADEAKGDGSENLIEAVMDRLAVNFGCEILQHVPGVVSTEIDARLSFDAEAMIHKARHIINLYSKKGFGKDRILIKLATTWEGVQAAKVLEREGIHCNMTLLFCLPQAIIAAHANATLISPFVGRITDWHKKATGIKHYEPTDDPGVQSVHKIFKYYKKFNHKTVVMGASFRNVDQILALSGCDKLTIAPKFLDVLSSSEHPVNRALSPDDLRDDIQEMGFTEAQFRWAFNEDACATEKLAEGIRRFAADSIKLENVLAGMLGSK